MPERLLVEISDRERVTALAYHAEPDHRLRATLVLAHGAGAGQSSRFMVSFASGLASQGLDVVTFNFLYTEQRRRAPDRTDKLEACYRAVVAAVRGHASFGRHALFIGGKSMGGRIASHLAAQTANLANGLIFLGYPLHPPGKPDQLRAAHLARISTPMLCVQGSRDTLGTPPELRRVFEQLNAPVTLHVVEDGDHSLVPPKTSGVTPEDVYGRIQAAIIEWVKGVAATRADPASYGR